MWRCSNRMIIRVHSHGMAEVSQALVVFYGRFPEDRGIAQVVQRLARNGGTVTVFSRASRVALQRSLQGVVRIVWASKSPGSLRDRLATGLLWWMPTWAHGFRKTLIEVRPAIVVVRELYWLPAVASIVRRDAPTALLVADVREHPDAYFTARLTSLQESVSGPRALRCRALRAALRKVDLCVCVSDELSGVMAEFGVHREALRTLENFPGAAFLRLCSEVPTRASPVDELRLVHAGAATPDRGISALVRAVAIARGTGIPVRLTVIGAGATDSGWQSTIAAAGASDWISLRAPCSPDQLPSVLGAHDLGACVNEVSLNSKATYPGKLWEYMAASLPVLTNERPTVAQTVGAARCGVVSTGSAPTDLAEALATCWKDRHTLVDAGTRGREYLLARMVQCEARLPQWFRKDA